MRNRAALAASGLHDQRPSGRQQASGFRNDGTVSVEAVSASIQCAGRVMVAHFAVELGNIR